MFMKDQIFFFFSSRRRHTRLQGDWSSDVCSSDLGTAPATLWVAAESLMKGWTRLIAEAGSCASGFGVSWFPVLNTWYTPRSSDAPWFTNDWLKSTSTESQHAGQDDQPAFPYRPAVRAPRLARYA